MLKFLGMQRLILFVFISILSSESPAQLKVSPDQHFLLKKNGQPFFWLGDTAWELFHRLNREEAVNYLQNRSDKGFTVIQAVVLAELDGLNTPNAYGDKPLYNNDPEKPVEAYFKHVDFIINEANKRGLIIALLPTWGDKWNVKWGTGPKIFTAANAMVFGEWIGKRYKNKSLVWVMGGDRDLEKEDDYAVIRNMAKGIRKSDSNHLFTFHPQGSRSSFEFFPDEDWLSFHMSQTGHKAGNTDYKRNADVYALPIVKPHINGEPNYEDHPNDFKPMENGWLDDVDAREAAYWSMLTGAAGHTYGNHNIWQMYTEKRIPVSYARTAWQVAMNHPGAYQMGWMRKMLEKLNWQKLHNDQSLIKEDNPEGLQYKVAAVSEDRDLLLVYIPYGTKTTIKTAALNAEQLKGWWFNPRDGKTISLGTFKNTSTIEFNPTSIGRGSDWVLVLKDAAKNYPDPEVN